MPVDGSKILKGLGKCYVADCTNLLGFPWIKQLQNFQEINHLIQQVKHCQTSEKDLVTATINSEVYIIYDDAHRHLTDK